jgi:hypothetical protein
MNFQLEITSFCDLECRECPNHAMKRKRAMMTREVWDTILRDYVVPFRHVNASGAPTLIPDKDGEPLLNKKILEYLKAASDLLPDLKFSIYTHGLRLNTDILAFLGSLPNRTQLMVTFHFYNHDGSLNDYTKTDALLRSWLSRPKLGPENIDFVLASHLVAPMTLGRLQDWKASWKSFEDAGRVKVHANTLISPWTGLMKDVATCSFFECPYQHFDHMFFGATGNVIACCMDLEEEIVFGNVLKDDPQVMFEKVRDFYAAQKRHEPSYEVCNDCFGLPPRQKQELLQLGVGK